MHVDNIMLDMEIDTGSPISCISKENYYKYFRHRPIRPFNLSFTFIDGSKFKPLGVIRPDVVYDGKLKTLELFVVEGGTATLLGRQWLRELGIKIPVFNCQTVSNDELCKLLDRYKELFSGGLGRFTGGKATLRVKEGAAPVYCRARPLPYALRDRVDHELDEMLRSGVIEPVDTSEWATPLVPGRPEDQGTTAREAAPTPCTPRQARSSATPPDTPAHNVNGGARHSTPPTPTAGPSNDPQTSPLPPPEPPQPRHVRECRILNPPRYKF
ncbi:uncharacterized protein K02A2.6-like [Cydia pomonella]|uniref:uncharacterized protein K02A2.6-like n=1 Tax=Cydia pomonella TaxID=82600 RepID=UPI002ADE4B7A|nr:uncharacterized protein K02A2.6-like [Cydia pomonella]